MTSTHSQVIAEIGVNHDGSLSTCKELISRAADAGANFVKVQVFEPEVLCRTDAPLARYQQDGRSPWASQREMLTSLALSQSDLLKIRTHARNIGVGFGATAFDAGSLAFAVEELQPDFIKVASADVVNLRILWEAGRSGLPMILSTGMARIDEIWLAVATIAVARTGDESQLASKDALLDAFAKAGMHTPPKNLTLLHCTSNYPAPLEEAHTRAIRFLQQSFRIPIGYSDHTAGSLAAITAVALGATMLEKHVTHDRSAAGPDHSASLDIDGFRHYVQDVRQAEAALGIDWKVVTSSEFANRLALRVGCYASRRLRSGDKIGLADLLFQRPRAESEGVDAWECLGRQVARDIEAGEPITIRSLK